MKKKAIDLIGSTPPIKFPHNVSRFFIGGPHSIEFASEQASFGEDYGSLTELRSAVEWLVDQLGGKVKWSKKLKAD